MTDSKYNLLLAVMQGDLEKVKAFLQYFDLPNSASAGGHGRQKKRIKLETLTDQQQFDLLRTAIEKSHQEIVKLLLDKGFKVCYENLKLSPTKLICDAVKFANAKILKLLLEREDVKAKLKKRDYNSLLLGAIESKNVEAVKVFLSYGADINASNSNGFALHQAIRHDSLEIVKLLLERGADLSITTSSGIIYHN